VQLENSDRFAWFTRLATFVLVVASLRFAQDVLIPVAFAVLLTFLLSPLVIRLMRIGLPKALAIIATVTFAFAVIGAIGWIVTTQVISLVSELPNYEENIQRKVATLKQPQMPGFVSRMAGMVENLQREIEAPSAEKQAEQEARPEEKPVPVEVRPKEPTPFELARDFLKPMLRPLAIAGIVMVFVVAMLFQREDLRDRFIKLVSNGKLGIATEAIEDAARRVFRYLGMQFVVNALYGVPLGIGLYLIGIPNALLWGVLATLLRFIPFLGPWIAAIFPVALSIAVDPGWSKFLMTAGFIVVMEVVSNNFVEIVLYGASTGISNMALLIAAVFWTWLWGPAGLVLSTPLTVCLLVLGTYVPGLRFLGMLLGSQPVMDPPAQFYQRMLSMESEDMLDLAANYISEHSVEEFYDNIFIPALLLSEADRHNGTLPEVRQRFIFQASRELIEELDRQDETAKAEAAPDDAREQPAGPTRPLVWGVAARDEADEIVALMVAHALRRRGIPAAALPLTASLEEAFADCERGDTRALFVSALPPSAINAARKICRRVRARCPKASLMVGMWQHQIKPAEIAERFRAAEPDAVVTNIGAALPQVERWINPQLAPEASATERPMIDVPLQPR
jgi:predicted PurR-regulated permease PerM